MRHAACGEQRLWPAAALTPLLGVRRYTTWSLLCARDVLASVFEDLSLLERSLGGDCPDEFNHAEYGARMRAEDEAEAASIAEQVAAAQRSAPGRC